MNIFLHAVKLILYLAYLSLIGSAVLRLINPGYPRGLADRAPVSLLLGAAALAVTLLPLSIFGVRTHFWMLGWTLAVTVIPAAIFARRSGAVPGTQGPRNSYEIAVFAAAALLLAGNYVLVAAYPRFDIDMVGHIFMKGKLIADSSYAGAAYFHDPVFASAHNTYPPLTVFLYGFMFIFGLGSVADYQAVNYFILFLTGVVLHKTLRPRLPAWQSLLWTLVLLSTAEYLRGEFMISSTDVFLSFAVLLTAAAFLKADSTRSRGDELLLSVLCAGSMLIKSDAAVFVAVLTICIWVRRRRFPLEHLLVIAAITGPWAAYRATLPDPGAGWEHVLRNFGSHISFSTLPAASRAAWVVLSRTWSGLFLIAPLVWLFFARKTEHMILMISVCACVLAYFTMIWGMIPVMPYYPQVFLRLLAHLYPLVILLTALTAFPVDDKKTGPAGGRSI